MNIKKIAKFLKEERENSNFTQEEAAKRIGVSKSIISKWENEKSYPSLENLSKISETYGISVNEILAGTRLGMNEKEIVSDENLLKEMQKTKVNRIAIQIIFIISLCTIMILLDIVCYMAGVNNLYYTMIFIIMLLFGLLVEFCIKNLK